MRPRSEWIIYAAAIVCVGLAIAGGLMYPIINQGPIGIILFEAPVFVGMIAIFVLIYRKGLPGS